ncbi:hypothetical protein LINPERPRIM_LOCUS13154, partial [Linum perenne]
VEERTKQKPDQEEKESDNEEEKSVEEETESDDSDFIISSLFPHSNKPKAVGEYQTRKNASAGRPRNGDLNQQSKKKAGNVNEEMGKYKQKAGGKRNKKVNTISKDDKKAKRKPPKKVVRSRCGPKKVLEILPKISASKLLSLGALGFTGTTQLQIGRLCEDFMHWALHCYNVETKSFEFVKNEHLTITAEDVSKVYGLPRGKLNLAKKVSEFKTSRLTELAKAARLEVDNKAAEMVEHKVLYVSLLDEAEEVKWKKIMILYIVSVLLCPKAHLNASLRFLPLMEDDCIGDFTKYNWCQYVVDHFHKGFKKAKENKKEKGTSQMFIGADIHLLMVCFCEEYGETTSETSPLCSKWDQESFKRTASMTKYQGGSTFPAGPPEPILKLPKPFKGIIDKLPSNWGDADVDEQEKVLTWLKMAKDVIEGEIQVTEQNIQMKNDEDMTQHNSKEGFNENKERSDEDCDEANDKEEEVHPMQEPGSKTKDHGSPNIDNEHTVKKGVNVREEGDEPKDIIAKRPKRMIQKSKKLLSPYTPIVYVRKIGARRGKSPPKPAMCTINISEKSLIDYARSIQLPQTECIRRKADMDLSLSRLQLQTLNYNEAIVTDVIDAYSDLLNLEQKDIYLGRPRRWIFPTDMAQTIHARITDPEMEDGEYMESIMRNLAKYDMKEDCLLDCEFIFFPICDSLHYSMFAINRRDKRFEFLDSKYPMDLEQKWQATGDRVVKLAVKYFQTFLEPNSMKDYTWFSMDGVYQPRGSNECGIYLLNLTEVWEGRIEDYMVHQWKLEDYTKNRRDAICLKLISAKFNTLFEVVKKRASMFHSLLHSVDH